MIPLDLSVRGAGYGEDAYHFEIARNSVLAPAMAGAVVANSLIGNPGYGRKATMFASGKIRLRGHPELPVEMAFAGETAGQHSGEQHHTRGAERDCEASMHNRLSPRRHAAAHQCPLQPLRLRVYVFAPPLFACAQLQRRLRPARSPQN